MNVSGMPLIGFLVLSLVVALVLTFSPSLFVFSLFNASILVVFLRNQRPLDETDGECPSFQGSQGEEEEEEEEDACDDVAYKDIDEDDDQYRDCGGSDGYREDDDDDGTDDEEIGLEKEESDNDLETRIEDFFGKVVKGWRDEWLRDKHQYGSRGCENIYTTGFQKSTRVSGFAYSQILQGIFLISVYLLSFLPCKKPDNFI